MRIKVFSKAESLRWRRSMRRILNPSSTVGLVAGNARIPSRRTRGRETSSRNRWRNSGFRDAGVIVRSLATGFSNSVFFSLYRHEARLEPPSHVAVWATGRQSRRAFAGATVLPDLLFPRPLLASSWLPSGHSYRCAKMWKEKENNFPLCCHCWQVSETSVVYASFPPLCFRKTKSGAVKTGSLAPNAASRVSLV